MWDPHINDNNGLAWRMCGSSAPCLLVCLAGALALSPARARQPDDGAFYPELFMCGALRDMLLPGVVKVGSDAQ